MTDAADFTIPRNEELRPLLTNSQLPELAREIETHFTAGKEARSRAKDAKEQAKEARAEAEEARAEAKDRFIRAGKALIKAKERATDFKSFVKEDCGLSLSWAYKLIQMAGGEAEVEKVQANARDRKRRQRERQRVRDTPDVTGNFSGAGNSVATDASAEARKAAYAEAEQEENHASDPADTTGSTADPIPIKRFPPDQAKEALKFSINRYWPFLDDAGRAEVKVCFDTAARVKV